MSVTIYKNHVGLPEPSPIPYPYQSLVPSYLPSDGSWAVYYLDENGSPVVLASSAGSQGGWQYAFVLYVGWVITVPASAPTGKTIYIEKRTVIPNDSPANVKSGRAAFVVGDECAYDWSSAQIRLGEEENGVISCYIIFPGWATQVPFSYAIDWGNGSTATGTDTLVPKRAPFGAGQTPVPFAEITTISAHPYATFGSYPVTLTLTSTDGCSVTHTFNQTVTPAFTRYVCAPYGCLGVRVHDANTGFALESECIAACHRCDYASSPLSLSVEGNQIRWEVTLTAGANWTPRVTYTITNAGVTSSPANSPSTTTDNLTYYGFAPRSPGLFTFTVEWSKSPAFDPLNECPIHIRSASLSVTDAACDYTETPITRDLALDGSEGTRLHLGTTNAGGWTLHIYYFLNEIGQTAPTLNGGSGLYTWSVPRQNGTHRFTAEWTKTGCPAHIVSLSFVIADTCPPAFNGAGWYCISGAPVQITTYEAWLAASSPAPKYAQKADAPCYTPPTPCANTLVFDSPAAGTSVRGLGEIVVHYEGNSPLAASAPVSIYWNGTSLPGVTASSGNPQQFVARVPAELGQYQGTIHLSAVLTHESGCQSPLITRDVLVNSTLLDDTRWGDFSLEVSAPHDSVQVDASFDPPTSASNTFYELAVCSPPPSDSPPPSAPTSAQQLALETTWAQLQKLARGADTPLLGRRESAGTYTAPTKVAICRVRAGAKSKRIKYALSAPLQKIRPFKNSDGSAALLFFALPFIYKLDATGFTLFQNLTFVQTQLSLALRDACVRGSKTYAVVGSGESGAAFAEIDTDAPDGAGEQISQLSTPFGAPPNAAFVETLKASSTGLVSFVRVYNSPAKAICYETYPGIDGLETRKSFETTGPISFLTVLGETLAFVTRAAGASSGTNGTQVYTWTRGSGAAPLLRATSTSPVVFVALESESGDLVYGTEAGDLKAVAGTSETLVVHSDHVVRAHARYRRGVVDAASTEEAPRVYGGDEARVWWKPASIFTPLLDLASGESVVALARFTETITTGSGSPLTGGTASQSLDSLLVGVHSSTENYVLRYQSQFPGALAYEGEGLCNFVFSSTLCSVPAVTGGI